MADLPTFGQFNPDTDPFAGLYSPSGQLIPIPLACYRVVSGILEYVARHPQTGAPFDTIDVLIGTIEIRNGHGLEYNTELLEQVRAELVEKAQRDAEWAKVGAQSTSGIEVATS